MWKTQPYASIARHGSSRHGRRPAIAPTSAKAPQTNVNTAAETAIRCATSGPNARNRPLSIKSKSTLVHCRTIDKTLGAAALDQLREPGVIDVAGEIAGLEFAAASRPAEQQQGEQDIAAAAAQNAGSRPRSGPSRRRPGNSGGSSNGVATAATFSPICRMLRSRIWASGREEPASLR